MLWFKVWNGARDMNFPYAVIKIDLKRGEKLIENEFVTIERVDSLNFILTDEYIVEN